MQNFNGLTPGEAERLAMLAEECAEVIQVIGKILRHGYESYHPDEPSITNRHLLEKEITDFRSVMFLMLQAKDVPDPFTDDENLVRAVMRKLKFAHHQ